MPEHDDYRSFFIGLGVGAVIGMAIGFLYAPKSGKETRAMLQENITKAKEKAKDIIEEATERAKAIVKKAKEDATEIEEAAQGKS
jgi:gas vesicle protein